MKFFLLSLLALTGTFSANAQSFAKGFGSTSLDNGKAITVDASGNVYTTGIFSGTVDFDPGPGVANLVSNGGSFDVFILKLDVAGNFVWAKSIGGTTNNDSGYGITIDASGNICITGFFTGTVDFDPNAGTTNLVSTGGSVDMYVLKLDAAGNLVWAKGLGGTGSEVSLFITTDASGNIYTTGYFNGTADFDPGAGTVNLVSAGGNDIFISKLDVSGNYVWAKNMSGTGNEQGNSIAVDASANVYITGAFAGTVDFDPGAATVNLASAGNDDIFISKLDASGNYVWAKSTGGINQEQGRCIKFSGTNIYLTGNFSGTVDFDPGAGTTNLINVGNSDIFISKFDLAGTFVWVKGIGSSGIDVGNGITLDAAGNIYTSGYFNATADFDPGAGTANLVSAGGNDVFISKLDASGNYVWAKNMGGTSGDIAYADFVDAAGNIYTTGAFDGTADFDPGAGTINLTSAGGGNDIFVSKLNLLGQVSIAATGLNFDGTNDYISIPHNTTLNPASLTVQAWVKTATNDGGDRGIVNKYFSSSSNGWNMYLLNGKLNAWYFGASGNIFNLVSSQTISDNAWHQVTFTVDNSGGKVFVDGVLGGSQVWSGTASATTTTQNVSIGLYPAVSQTTSFFNGSIDEVRIWNRALAQSEIQNNMSCEMTATGQTGLLALYHLNQGYIGESNSLVTAATDASGNSNTGTLNGFALTGATSNWVAGNATGSCPAPAGGLNFDGIDDRVQLPAPTVGNLSNFTVEAWAKWNGGSNGAIYSEGNSGSLNQMFSLIADGGNNGKFEIVLRNAASTGLVVQFSTGAVVVNTWTHVAFVRTSATTAQLYINGVNTDNFTFTDPGTFPLNVANIGVRQRSSFDGYFSGSIDEVRTWNRSLCQAEIQNNMNSSINAAAQSGLIAAYHFDHGNVAVNNAGITSLKDSGSSGYNGTLLNFTLNGAASNWVAGMATGTNPVYTPATLAGTSGGPQVSQTVTVNNTGTFYTDNSCGLIAKVLPSGGTPVTGNITSKVKIDATVQTYNSKPYVQRHYDIEPATNAANATATVTLYFTQAEFTAYNAARGILPALPTSAADATGIANMRITQYHGTGTAPGNYSGTALMIDPVNGNIIYNSGLSRWEVTIAVSGFSGFYVHTSSTAGPLPLTILSFTGKNNGNTKLLEWNTSNEINIKEFVLERSTDNNSFKDVATITAKGAITNSYLYNDTYNFDGTVYYRLRVIDNGGRITYSNTVGLTNKQTGIINIFPNPVVNKATLQVTDKKLIGSTAVITDAEGKTMQTFIISNNITVVDMDHLPAGIYILKTISHTQKIIKQ
jgi:hypothetical protein